MTCEFVGVRTGATQSIGGIHTHSLCREAPPCAYLLIRRGPPQLGDGVPDGIDG
jgi:hypothetical protein